MDSQKESYCWWFRNPANQLRLVVYPMVYRVLYIPGGCLAFDPSTVHPFGVRWNLVNSCKSRVDVSPSACQHLCHHRVSSFHICDVSSPWPFCSTHQSHVSYYQGMKGPRQHDIGLCQSATLPTDDSQTWKACRPCHIVQALIELCSKSQTLNACWPCHVV